MPKHTLLWCNYLMLGAIIVIVFSQVVPFNMDEFIHYHNITCAYYPLNKLNEFREACGSYDLNFLNLGVNLPLRTFVYSGSLPSVYYYPLFVIWRSPESARYLGYLFLLLQAVLLRKIFRISLPVVLTGLLLFFPYSFQHFVDTGPVGLQATSVFLLYWMMEKWLRKEKLWYPVAMAIILFLCIWTKSFYLVLLPGIAVLFLIRCIEFPQTLWSSRLVRTLALQGVIALCILIALTGALYFSTQPGSPSSYPFLEEIRTSPKQSIPETFRTIADAKTTRMIRNPLNATHRIYAVTEIGPYARAFNAVVYLVVPIAFLVAVAVSQKILWRSGLMYTAFLGTFFAISMTPRADSMHHIVLAFPFLIISIVALMKELGAMRLRRFHWHAHRVRQIGTALWIIGFVALNGYCFFAFPWQRVLAKSDVSISSIHEILWDAHMAEEYIYVVLDWGMYYRLGLYGDRNQSVIYAQNLYEDRHMDTLQRIADSRNRKLAFIYSREEMSSNIEKITARFRLQRCDALPADVPWQLLLQESGNFAYACTRPDGRISGYPLHSPI